MSSDSSANGSVDRPADAPVLDPRPVYRPQIDPASRQVFGRPSGVEGSFTPVAARSTPSSDVVIGTPDPVLAEAFGRPADATESIGRDPEATANNTPDEENAA